MSRQHPVDPVSLMEDQIRYLDDFLREGGDADATPSPDSGDTRRPALQQIRVLLAEVHQQVVAHPGF
jgi:hypothetical protein